MLGLWGRLETLRAIVDTARADEVEHHPDSVRTRYEPYAEVYYVIEAVKRVEQQLTSELREGHAVTGYLSADYGYGKTATAIYLWKRCLDSGLVAVPPFMLRQLKNIMQATKGWLRYQLQHREPRLISRLDEAYERHAERSAEELVKEIAHKQGISETKARAIVLEYIGQRRDLTTPGSLLPFLDDATEIAREAGFKGLVVFADESQEFLRTEDAGAHEAIQTLSELVKGIRARSDLPVGLMLVMPAQPTEAAIEEQAGDIMQRMRERGTALRLQDAYGREFPKDLWDHLCKLFDDTRASQAVDRLTLDALGQLCERKDLSNGPRTVINAFRRIAVHNQQNQRPYTPIDLMDDYLHGHIVFEGREAKLTGTLRRLLEMPVVQRNPEYQKTVKLLAAFPRGVDEKKADKLYAAIGDLADREQWLGEHVTQLAEGYALVGLQERAEARPVLDEIIRDFRRRWYHVWDENTKALLAATAFFQDILPMLFPPRTQGKYADFGGHKNYVRVPPDVTYVVLDGCFENLFSRFPDRRVRVSVSVQADALARLPSPDEDTDLDFRFFLISDGKEEQSCSVESANQDRRVDFLLNLKCTFGRRFPTDLVFLQDIMAPEHTSAQTLLGLSMRMMGWLAEHSEVSEADRQMIEAQRRALHRHALQLLLPNASDPARVRCQGIKVSGAEQKLIESAFEAKCLELYPDYKPLMVTKEWKNHLLRYRDALSRRPLAERRGRHPMNGSKEEIAKAFGMTHSVFESSAATLRNMGLLDFNWGKGRGSESEASIQFREHALEILLRETLQREGQGKTISIGGRNKTQKSMDVGRLQKMARPRGYLPEEVDEALNLLVLRQYVQREPDGTVHEFAGAVDADELSHQARELEDQLNRLDECFGKDVLTYTAMLREARENLAGAVDEVVLDAVQRKLDELRLRLEEFIKSKSREVTAQFSVLKSDLERLRDQLSPRELEQQIMGTVEFVRHVDDQRIQLRRRFQNLQHRHEQLMSKVEQAHKAVMTVVNEESLCRAERERRELGNESREIEKRLDDLRPYLVGLQRWRELVAKTTGLRERLGPESLFRERLDADVSMAVMENFANRQMEALLDWERFNAEVGTIEAELNMEENRRRDEFLRLKEKYEDMLKDLMPQRMVQATFDPKDSEQSYQVLYTGVHRKLQDWLTEQTDFAQRAVSEFDYLIRERGVGAHEERNRAQQVLESLQKKTARLNQELVRIYDEFKQYCQGLDADHRALQDVQKELDKRRAEKGDPTDEEEPVLQVLTGQRRNLEDIRHRLPAREITLDNLLELIKGLYRKGYVEIEVRKRE